MPMDEGVTTAFSDDRQSVPFSALFLQKAATDVVATRDSIIGNVQKATE